jgi:hypothetical protein
MNLNEKMGFAKRQARAATQLLLSTTRLHQPERRIGDDAQEFWRSGRHASWREDSHWREARLVQGNDLWTEMGCRHLDLMEQGARLLRRDHRTWGRVIDWGCGQWPCVKVPDKPPTCGNMGRDHAADRPKARPLGPVPVVHRL